jgi:hypothetical protein
VGRPDAQRASGRSRRLGAALAEALVMSSFKPCLAALLLAAGCGTSIQATAINPSPYPLAARPPMSVELFTSGPPARPYVDVALLEAEATSSLSTDRTPEMLSALRARGAQLGCDGIVLGGMSSRDPSLGDAETWLVEHPRGRNGVYATCIVYTAPPMVSARAAPTAAAAPAAPPPEAAAPHPVPAQD